MPDQLALVFRAVDLIGVLLNGIIGATMARERRFDAVGFGVLAIISALGGGVLRDVLLMSGRPVALTDPYYLICALLGAFIAFLLHLRGRIWDITYRFLDAIVLGSWAAAGTTKSLAAGLDWLPSLLLGMATAVGGGMIRDVAIGKVPEVFGGNNLYATPALLSGGIVVLGYAFKLPPGIIMVTATILGAGFALLAHVRGWQLPVADDSTMVTMTRGQLRDLIRRIERRSRRKPSANDTDSPELDE